MVISTLKSLTTTTTTSKVDQLVPLTSVTAMGVADQRSSREDSSVTQDTIFGVFSVVLAFATLAIAVLQVVHFQILRKRNRFHDRQREEDGSGVMVVPIRTLTLPKGRESSFMT
ncbi:hypothetical protein MMYC01_208329 [Madurella mycetomatis]|uniref:Uncharacterized protein n=1 Tax=Madurella mycetomatis TaxID=100816 RepID=A0A175VVF9_9PEZI|nr:hypothetical protein MMYC01_208329 [Madurella mycetomatis]